MQLGAGGRGVRFDEGRLAGDAPLAGLPARHPDDRVHGRHLAAPSRGAGPGRAASRGPAHRVRRRQRASGRGAPRRRQRGRHPRVLTPGGGGPQQSQQRRLGRAHHSHQRQRQLADRDPHRAPASGRRRVLPVAPGFRHRPGRHRRFRRCARHGPGFDPMGHAWTAGSTRRSASSRSHIRGARTSGPSGHRCGRDRGGAPLSPYAGSSFGSPRAAS